MLNNKWNLMKYILLTETKELFVGFEHEIYHFDDEEMPLLIEYDVICIMLPAEQNITDTLLAEIRNAAEMGSIVILFVSKESDKSILNKTLGLTTQEQRVDGKIYNVPSKSAEELIREVIESYSVIIDVSDSWDSLAYFRNRQNLIAGFKEFKEGIVGVFPKPSINECKKLKKTIELSLWWKEKRSPISFIKQTTIWCTVCLILCLLTVTYLRTSQQTENQEIIEKDWLHAKEVKVSYWQLKSDTIRSLLLDRLTIKELDRLSSKTLDDKFQTLEIASELGRPLVLNETLHALSEQNTRRALIWLINSTYTLIEQGSFRKANGRINTAISIMNMYHFVGNDIRQTIMHLKELLKYNFLSSDHQSIFSYHSDQKNIDKSLNDNYAYKSIHFSREEDLGYEEKQFKLSKKWMEFAEKFPKSEKKDEAIFNAYLALFKIRKKNALASNIALDIGKGFINSFEKSYLADDLLYYFAIHNSQLGFMNTCKDSLMRIATNYENSDYYYLVGFNSKKSMQMEMFSKTLCQKWKRLSDKE